MKICKLSICENEKSQNTISHRLHTDRHRLFVRATCSDKRYNRFAKNNYTYQEIYMVAGSRYKVECFESLDKMNLTPLKADGIFSSANVGRGKSLCVSRERSERVTNRPNSIENLMHNKIGWNNVFLKIQIFDN